MKKIYLLVFTILVIGCKKDIETPKKKDDLKDSLMHQKFVIDGEHPNMIKTF